MELRYDRYGNRSVKILDICSIHPDADIGRDVEIGAFCCIEKAFIADGVKIGALCYIGDGVKVTKDVPPGSVINVEAMPNIRRGPKK